MEETLDLKLNEKDQKRRDSILNKSLWKVVLAILVPIAMYNFLTFLFGVFDLKIVSMFPNDPKDSVAFFDEIKNAISAFGGGFAAGGAVIVANLYGEGKIDEARKNAGVVLILTTLISVGIIILTVVGVIPLLRLINFDSNIIDAGAGYFYIQIATTALTAINVVFIGLEKAKGNTRTIFYLNIAVAVIKVSLTLFVVFVLNLQTIEWVAVTTLIAQLVLTIIAIFAMFSKKNIFRINIRNLSFNKKYIKAMFIISIPVIFGKFIFSLGKVIVNLFATIFYGAEVLSALTITYKANLGIGAIANSLEESEMTIISQNIGNKNPKRAFKTVQISAIYTLIITVVGVILITLLADPAVKFFVAKPEVGDIAGWILYDQKVTMAKTILKYERFSMLTTAFIGVFLGGFYGFKMTKVSYGVNVVRLFVFRIPVLVILYYFFKGVTGPHAIGLTMFISNAATAVLVLILFLGFYYKSRNNGFQEFVGVSIDESNSQRSS